MLAPFGEDTLESCCSFPRGITQGACHQLADAMAASYASTSVGEDSSNGDPSMENDQIIGTANE
jgi:hypothetical protein